MDNRETALYIFRRLVYVLYLEIGALQPANHAAVAKKARLNTAFFQGRAGLSNRKRQTWC